MNDSSQIMDSVMENIRRWRGGISDRFANISNITNSMIKYQKEWDVPSEMLTTLTENSKELQMLVNKCRGMDASSASRMTRNSLLKSITTYCRKNVRIWAYGRYEAGAMTADDVHLLGFLLPGENGGPRSRIEPSNELAYTKVRVLNEDIVRVIVNRSFGENAAQVTHGWPRGVRHALIVVMNASGAEIYRQMTTRLHNTIPMPNGTHGQQFIVKAAFLRHVDDVPLFGNQAVFSLPRNTTDLLAGEVETETSKQKTELLRLEIERLQAEIEHLNRQIEKKD
jgi:hypothetical protein